MIVSGALLLTEMLRFADAFCAVGVSESVTVTVKVKVPVEVGVPPMLPAAFSDNPAGRLPDVTAQVYEGTPPDACSVAL